MKKLKFEFGNNVIEIDPLSGSFSSNLLDDYKGKGPAGVGVDHDAYFFAICGIHHMLITLACAGKLDDSQKTTTAIQAVIDDLEVQFSNNDLRNKELADAKSLLATLGDELLLPRSHERTQELRAKIINLIG